MSDPVRNFAFTTVEVAPTPADTGTAITPVDPTLFPDPTDEGFFNVVVFPEGEQPNIDNAEIIRVRSFSSGEWDEIEREQEDTQAREIQVGDQIMLGVTAKTITDLSLYERSVTHISEAQLLDLHNTPVILIPAPGSGKFLVPCRSTAVYIFGTHPYYIASNLKFRYEGLGGDSELGSSGAEFFIQAEEDRASWQNDIGSTDSNMSMAELENLALVLEGDLRAGEVVTHEVFSGGVDYAVGDTGFAPDLNSVNYTVDTVDGLGAVLTYTLDSLAPVYGAEQGTYDTYQGGAQMGIGTGFVIKVLTVVYGDGEVRYTIDYMVEDVS
jgi:hypothetical protein